MNFDTTTFILEIINFLILIWILQKLFYKPLLAIIAKRKQFIDESLEQAKTIQQQANEQSEQYEQLQQQWQQEKQTAFNELQQQIAITREKQLAKLANEFEQEKQKINQLLSHQEHEVKQQLEQQALQNGTRFAALILQQAASPELEARLISLLLDQLNSLPQTDNKKTISIHITSAYPLNPEQQQQLEQKLNSLLKHSHHFHYHQDKALIAGLCIEMGTWLLQANLQHELAGFVEITQH